MILLIDTCVLIDVLRRRRGRSELLRKLASEGHALGTSAICVAEVYAGMRPGERAETALLLEGLLLFSVSYDVAKRTGELKYDQARNGRTFDFPDLIVAATALENDLTIFTDNRRDFPFAGLSFFEAQD